MIEVLKGSVKANGIKYGIGELIKDLSKNDEAYLVKCGIAKYSDGAAEKKQPGTNKKNEKAAIKQEIPDEEASDELASQADENITFNADDYIEEANKGKKSGKAGK